MPKAIGEWKVCSGCKEKKHVSEFRPQKDKADGLTYSCKSCLCARTRARRKENKETVAAYNKGYRKRNKEKIHAYQKEYEEGYKERRNKLNLKYKQAFLIIYGEECACCGETRYEFLTIEHKNGRPDKKEHHGRRSYIIACNEYRPDLYETLCMNCNFSKGKYGYCPHDNER